MDQEFFTESQLNARAEVYTLYRGQLQSLEFLHEFALMEVKEKILARQKQFMAEKSAAAVCTVDQEETRNKAKIKEKIQQIDGLLPLGLAKSPEEMIRHLHSVKAELEKTRPCTSSFDETIAKAIEKFPRQVKKLCRKLKVEINGSQRSFEKSIEDAWVEFKEFYEKNKSLSCARSLFKIAVQMECQTFEGKVESARAAVLAGINDSKLVYTEYARVVAQTVDEYTPSVYKWVQQFSVKMSQLVEEEEAKMSVTHVVRFKEQTFNEELKEVRDSFDKLMEEARNNFQLKNGGVIRDPEAEINALKDVGVQGTKDAWQTFREKIRIRRRNEGLEENLDLAVTNFQSEVCYIRDTFRAKFSAIKHELLDVVDGPGKMAFETAVAQAVEEFVWWAYCAHKYFFQNLDEVVKREQERENEAKNKLDDRQQLKRSELIDEDETPKKKPRMEDSTVTEVD